VRAFEAAQGGVEVLSRLHALLTRED